MCVTKKEKKCDVWYHAWKRDDDFSDGRGF